VPPQQWTRPKKKNRGLARGAARNPAGKGKGKAEGVAPAGPPPEAAAPKAAPATGPTPSPPATTGGEENKREESDRVLRDRERSWADASEELEEAQGRRQCGTPPPTEAPGRGRRG